MEIIQMEKEIEKKIIFEYVNSNESLNKISNKYNVDFKTAKRLLLKNGIEFKPRRNTKTLDENHIIDLYINKKLGVVDISKILKTNHKKVSAILKKNNIFALNKCKYSINENYFENIDNQYKAYLLGFITADGYMIVENGNLRFGITIKDKDIEILKYFKKYTNSNSPIHFLKRNNMVRISINNQNFNKHLFDKGIVPNKTFNTIDIIKNIPNNLIRHFIRGYFDGDGTVFSDTRNSKLLRVGILGNVEFITELQKILNMGKIYTRNYTNVVDLSIKPQKDIEKFKKIIYLDSKIHLKRKYIKFIE